MKKNNTKRLVIEREFSAPGALMDTGGNRVINLPEVPLNSFITLMSVDDRKSELDYPAPFICDVTLKISGVNRVIWPEDFIKYNKDGIMVAKKTRNNDLIIKFNIKKEIKGGRKYTELKIAFETFRDFMATPLLLSN